ncbi:MULTISPECIES: MFS transporter [unclassified Bacteroides]|uniref:MFS transporter n=1 Tax=unclassified Bacteroides TaxID=2646097 RepID=UPI0021ACC4EC|nr:MULTISPECIES: MFS transporter [unclassified Bacteroides]MCR8893224.1 MFS transporter [Bacteroides sp. ET336]MDN0057721.1 MFS transporter [Bacteroides caecigallinarum]MDN0072658.1 MFS transporter [Bacteroides caecigallinarum]
MDNSNTKRRSPITWVPSAYFAMGLPFVVLNMVTVLMFKGLEVDDKLITFWTSLILLPWTLKPLWSPFLELFKTKKFFVVATQLTTGIAFGLVALSLNLSSFFAISIALLAVIAFSGATHDIACDGVYMSELSNSEQAKYIGWQGAFYNIAKIVATGGLVYLAGYFIESYSEAGSVLEANKKSWMTIMLILSAVMILLALYHIFALPSTKVVKNEGKRSGKEILSELYNVLSDFFRKTHIIYYICFIILYRFAEGFVMKIVPLFLKAAREAGGLGLSEKEIGLYYGTYGAAAFVLGSLLAGYYISAKGLKNTLFTLCCIFNLPFVVYAFLAFFQPESGLIICSGIVFEYFGYGFGFVGLTLFMMQQVAPGKHQMAHYAFASGIMNLGVMIPGMMSGWVCETLGEWFNRPGGYEPFFIFVLIATIPAFLITYFIPFKYNQDGTLIEGQRE